MVVARSQCRPECSGTCLNIIIGKRAGHPVAVKNYAYKVLSCATWSWQIHRSPSEDMHFTGLLVSDMGFVHLPEFFANLPQCSACLYLQIFAHHQTHKADGYIGADGFLVAMENRRGLQVQLAHAERLLHMPQLAMIV